MTQCQTNFPVKMMCRMLGVPTAGFHECLGREPSSQTQRREAMGEVLEEIFPRHKRRYGAPRVKLALNAAGVDCVKNIWPS